MTRFDRVFWPLFTTAAVLAIAGSIAYLLLIAAGINWIWSVTP